MEMRYFTKKTCKEFRQSTKNVDLKCRTDIGERMKNWEILRTMTRNQLHQEVDKWHYIVSKVVGKRRNTVLKSPRVPVVNLWYTEEDIRDLCRKAEASRSSEDWNKFRGVRRENTKNVRKAARDCYLTFGTDLPTPRPWPTSTR